VIRRSSRRAALCKLLVLLAGTATAVVPHYARSQPRTTPWRIGVLTAGTWPEETVQEFRQALAEAGYFEGKNVVIEWRPASGHFDRLPQLAADLVRSKVDVIVADGTVAVRALRSATSTIPIVIAFVSDPIGAGLVPNLVHPGGNITGLSMMTSELSVKRLELLPGLHRVAVLWNPDTPPHKKTVQLLTATAPLLSVDLKFVAARKPEEFDSAFSIMRRWRAQALDVLEDAMFTTHRTAIYKLALDSRLPSIYWDRSFAAGGLMSYGTWQGDYLRGAVGYMDRILKGANPADLPIEQPTKFELVINLKTAKALGIAVPESILLRADEVIR
jgi:putative tryptophan/tyrosine transport system substrate-binding protein